MFHTTHTRQSECKHNTDNNVENFIIDNRLCESAVRVCAPKLAEELNKLKDCIDYEEVLCRERIKGVYKNYRSFDNELLTIVEREYDEVQTHKTDLQWLLLSTEAIQIVASKPNRSGYKCVLLKLLSDMAARIYDLREKLAEHPDFREFIIDIIEEFTRLDAAIMLSSVKMQELMNSCDSENGWSEEEQDEEPVFSSSEKSEEDTSEHSEEEQENSSEKSEEEQENINEHSEEENLDERSGEDASEHSEEEQENTSEKSEEEQEEEHNASDSGSDHEDSIKFTFDPSIVEKSMRRKAPVTTTILTDHGCQKLTAVKKHRVRNLGPLRKTHKRAKTPKSNVKAETLSKSACPYTVGFDD